MADTDDEPTAELGPAHHAEGEDQKAPGAEAAGEDRRAKEWEAVALRRADLADTARADYRAEAAGERRLARIDVARASRLRDGAAGRDDPAAEADRARADRYQAMSNYETRLANSDDAISDSYGAEASDLRGEAAQVQYLEQPPAAEAARIPPQQAPRARKNLKQRRPKTKELKDFGLGD
jgi:hypothetical protein